MARKDSTENGNEPQRGDNSSDICKPSKLYSIFIMVLSYVLIVIGAGLSHSYGILLVFFVEAETVSPSEGAWAVSIEQFCFYSTGCIFLPLIEKLGWRISVLIGTLLASTGLLLSSFITSIFLMYITYGIMTGVGLGIVFIVASIVIENYWENHLYFAMAAIATAFETGLMAFGPIMQALLDSIGWRDSQRVFAGVVLIGLIAVLAYKPIHKENKHDENDSKESPKLDNSEYKAKEKTVLLSNEENDRCCGNLTNRFYDLWGFYCNIDFILFGASYFCYTWSYDAPFTFLPMLAQSYNIVGSKYSTLLTMFGVSGIIVRVATVLLPKQKLKRILVVLGVMLIFNSVTSALVPLCTNYHTLAIYSVCIGSVLSYIESTFLFAAIVLMDTSNKEQITAGLFMANAFADISNGPASGGLIERTKNAVSAFLLAALFGLLATLFYCAAVYVKRDQVRNAEKEENSHMHISDVQKSEDNIGLEISD